MGTLQTMSKTQPTILVTGGAGYIGSHVVLLLQQAGYEVLVFDNLERGHRHIVETVLQVPFICGDTRNRQLLDQVFQTHNIAAVMHFAAYAYVGESFLKPGDYYSNNVIGTLTLLEAMMAAGVDKFVFSSTCATYGIPETFPITETSPQQPINPYGASKLMCERILADFNQAYDLKSVCLRYFNAAGADPNGLLGEDHDPETHLLPLVLLTALGNRDSVSIYGTDYETPDGTCIRDYIHVCDLASAHLLALEYLLKGGKTEIFNLGNGNGFSVRQVIETAQNVTGKPIKVVETERRAGDPAILVASSDKAKEILGWTPEYGDLNIILNHAWQWHQKCHAKPKVTTA